MDIAVIIFGIWFIIEFNQLNSTIIKSLNVKTKKTQLEVERMKRENETVQ